MTALERCVACGEQVDGARERRCRHCGLPLGRRGPAGVPSFGWVLVADDAPFFRSALERYLVDRGLARGVVTAADGAEVVEKAVGALRNRRPLDLLVLDVLMPRLNGVQAAVAVRAAERAFGVAPAPVLFLSSRHIDAAVQTVLRDLSPAYYADKGGQGGALLETDRFQRVIERVPVRRTAGIRP